MREYATSLSASAGMSLDAMFFSASVKSTYDFSSSKKNINFIILIWIQIQNGEFH